MSDEGIPDAVKAAWDNTLAKWEDPAAHEALLSLVTAYGCYAWAAAKYMPHARDPIAEAALERVRKAATASLMSTAMARPKVSKEKMPYRSSLFVLIVVGLMIGIGFLYASWRQHQAEDADAPATTDVQH